MKTFKILIIIFLSVNVWAQNTMFIPDLSGEALETLEINDSIDFGNTPLAADIVVINELHMLPDSGRSGYPLSITFTINNTDQFSAFQFDVILPSVLTFIQDSVWLFRKTDHIILANQVNQETLRILAYSPSNQTFTGNDGEIVRIMFNLNGSAGTYDVGLNNVTISNPVGTNILTGIFPSFIKITSPDISGQTSINFGEVSVIDTLSFDYQLNNTGNDTLFVTDFFSADTFFWNDTPLPQNIPPFDSISFNLKFHNINKGLYSTTFTIGSNDPDEDPFFVDAAASSFAPNYILIQDAEAFVGDTVTLKIDVNNYEQFFDFQIDLDFPDSLTYVTNSATLTNRKQDHTIHENLLTPNKIRLFSFSLNQLPFIGDTGTVAIMNFVVGNDTGTFPLDLSGGILFDSSSQNIIRGSIAGEIHVKERPVFQLTVTVVDGWNMVSVPGTNTDGQGVDFWWSGRDPGASVFKYLGGYVIINTTTPGEGYWMKHIGANVYNTGDEWSAAGIQTVPHNPISASAGWNIFGGYEDTVATSGLTTTPPGLISGSVFGYSGGYQIAANLVPGYGYWIKLSGDGVINIPDSTLSKGSSVTEEYFKKDWGKIIFTDNAGRSYTLYAVNDEVGLDNYELPPAPPSGMFDIRYGSGRIAEDINSSIKSIEMTGLEYPVRVEVENMSITLQDESGKIFNAELAPGESITIENNSINKLMVLSGGIVAPIEYALQQNYPNPFNPSTIISWQSPVSSWQTLKIFDVLGNEIVTLMDEYRPAGEYEVEFNPASGIRFPASGIYFYQLRAGSFVETKKMMLLK